LVDVTVAAVVLKRIRSGLAAMSVIVSDPRATVAVVAVSVVMVAAGETRVDTYPLPLTVAVVIVAVDIIPLVIVAVDIIPLVIVAVVAVSDVMVAAGETKVEA
jgi:hypothetical protein